MKNPTGLYIKMKKRRLKTDAQLFNSIIFIWSMDLDGENGTILAI
jgi:hypothetical protein